MSVKQVLAVIGLAGSIAALSGCSQGTPEEQLAAVDSQYQAVADRYQLAYDSAATEEEADAAFQNLFPNRNYFTKKYLQIAERNIGHEVEAAALRWIVAHGDHKHEAAALDALFARHLHSKEMAVVARRLRLNDADPSAEQRLKMLVDKSPHVNVKAAAKYALAEFYQQIISRKEYLQAPEDLAWTSKHYSVQTIDYWRNLQVDNALVESLYEQVIAHSKEPHGDVVDAMVERSASALFAMRNLQPGQPAPEIEAPDLNSEVFRLSDYRGKVVLLSFWGHW